MFAASLLDVDGVMLCSEPMYLDAVNETFAPYGVRLDEQEYATRYMVTQTGTRGVIEEYGIPESYEDVHARKAAIVERMVSEGRVDMMPGAGAMLCNMKGKYRLGLVTSANETELRTKIGRFGIERVFEVMVWRGMTKNGKSGPEPYLKGAELLDLPPGEIFVVEDTPTGVSSAREAGCAVIAYPNGFTFGMEFPDADMTIRGLGDIGQGLLEELYRETSDRR
jgi:HAD superfamily hydrolase (TIGR01509 family)